MGRSHKKCPEEHRAGRRVAVAAGMPKPAGERFFAPTIGQPRGRAGLKPAPTTPGRDDKHGRGMPRPYGKSHFLCRVCLLVLADKTNNNALLALVPIKSDSNCVTSIPTAPRSDVLL